MKKVALVIGMVIVLVGLVMGGRALHANAAAPTLKIASFSGAAPSTMTVAGYNWTPGVKIDLNLDSDNTLVATALPASNGVFVCTVPIGPTNVGVHKITAMQIPEFATASFLVISSQLPDPRITSIIDNVGLFFGLSNIATVSTAGTTKVGGEDFGKRGHVSLTLFINALAGGDSVDVIIENPSYAEQIFVHIVAGGIGNYQFDTSGFKIVVNTVTPPAIVGYIATVTLEQ